MWIRGKGLPVQISKEICSGLSNNLRMPFGSAPYHNLDREIIGKESASLVLSMCGIFGYVGPSTKAANIVFKGLKDLEYRGYDSWGIAAVPTIKEGKIVVKKKTGKIGNAKLDGFPKSSIAFGHTRGATHGGVTDT